MKVTEHVTEDELACKDGPDHSPGTPYPFDAIDDNDMQGRTWRETRAMPLCETFEAIRAAAGDEPIDIRSGFRTIAYDEKLYEADRGAGNVAKPQGSQHPKGRALDVSHRTLSAPHLFSLILGLFHDGQLPHLGGLGLYPHSDPPFVHIDVRPRPIDTNHLAIWGGTRPSNIV